VRHPIYTGILLAVVGTTRVERPQGIVMLTACLAYFTHAAKMEERSMKHEFPTIVGRGSWQERRARTDDPA